MSRLLIFLLLLVLPHHSASAPVAVYREGVIEVVLTDEECRLTRLIVNLPYRAVWTEQGKRWEGCYSVGSGGLIVFYWSSREVGIGSLRDFSPYARSM